MSQVSDVELVRAAERGDRLALDRVVEVCRGMAARFVDGQAASEADGRQQVQRAVQAVLARLHDYEGTLPFFVFAFACMARSAAERTAPETGAPSEAFASAAR
jgi:DNA-directed RNA polymerase specialized sigma24 family protein